VKKKTGEAMATGSMESSIASPQAIVPAAATCQGGKIFAFYKGAQLKLQRA